MSKALRFWCHDASNIRCVREEDYDAAQSELAALREELAEAKRQLNLRDEGPNCWTCGDQGYVHSIDGELRGTCDNCTVYELTCTKHSLTAAEQRNSELKVLLRTVGATIPHLRAEVSDSARELVRRINAVLKPTESGASE